MRINWTKCTKNGKFARITCYGLQHGLITAVIVGIATAINPQLSGLVGLGVCGFFVWRELRGVGGLFDNADRLLDWVVPCLVAGGIYYQWGEYPDWVSLLSNIPTIN